MKTDVSPADCVGRRQDGVWDAELRVQLRSTSEARRAEFLADILVRQEAAGFSTRPWFDWAKSLLAERSSFELILTRGLHVMDASSMQAWLRHCLPRLGMRRTIRIIEQEGTAIEYAQYWLARVARNAEERELAREFNAMHS